MLGLDLSLPSVATLSQGQGEADRIRAIGLAQAEATEKQVEAYGGPQYQLNSTVLLRFAEAIENGKLPLVPGIVVGGGDGRANGGGLVEMLLAMLVSEKEQARKGLPQA